MTKAIPLIIFACLWAGAIRAEQEAAAPEPMLAAASRPDSAPATALEGAKAGDSAPLPAAPSAPSPGATLPQWPLPASGTSAATATLVEVADPTAKLPPVSVAPLQAVPLYRQDELLDWIEQGRHLKQVRQDRCQLTQDIEARAKVMKIPSYQFLWGDMLAWGVCVKPDAEQGVKYLWAAAEQGLAPALEQLGRYYWKGILVQKDALRAETLMREAASQGLLKAQLEWVEMLLAGLGSPLDYEEAYQWLHGAVIGDKALHGRAASLLSRLAARMPANAVARAKAMR
ncbi:tetratricopeptide repeat protein [Aeromonas bivalvium]|uniref:tetratricopeptide repeat protein n=1 Tax=Aeromonas bivalvium TaxID=440079 RepID=UPI000A7E0334|nr:sel1 repeat family protein [Aeromonas bivalvium]